VVLSLAWEEHRRILIVIRNREPVCIESWSLSSLKKATGAMIITGFCRHVGSSFAKMG
jgi:hypothetical protein